MTKDMMIKALSEFMASKGVDSMTLVEYKGYGRDEPVKDYLLKRVTEANEHNNNFLRQDNYVKILLNRS